MQEAVGAGKFLIGLSGHVGENGGSIAWVCFDLRVWVNFGYIFGLLEISDELYNSSL